jgi:hypothetical protein
MSDWVWMVVSRADYYSSMLSSSYYLGRKICFCGESMFHSAKDQSGGGKQLRNSVFQPDRPPHVIFPTSKPSTSTNFDDRCSSAAPAQLPLCRCIRRPHSHHFILTFTPDPDTPQAYRPTTPAIMLSLVLTILFVHIAIYLVNTIGASTIDSLVCRSLIQLRV